MIEKPYPTFNDLLAAMGEVGARLAQMGAAEGAAGNLSICCGWRVEPDNEFTRAEPVVLPVAAPVLERHSLLVTGSGRRLGDIALDAGANVGLLVVDPGGETGRLYTTRRARFARLTSELNSHIAVHADQVARTRTNFHTLVHAQPTHLTYLSHIPRYREEGLFNRQVMRWEPELILQMPEGMGVLPFCVPGSAEMMETNRAGMREHQLVVWSKHGVMARCNRSLRHACDLIDYAETGARYEFMNLTDGGLGEGLTAEEIRAVCAAWGVKQDIF